jgi:hypothetical protein
VVVTTVDAAGEAVETRLWIVDYQDSGWLRAGTPGAGWFARLQANPNVSVERGATVADYTAVPVAEEIVAVNALMMDKYGWAESYIGLFFSRAESVPIRLDPVL